MCYGSCGSNDGSGGGRSSGSCGRRCSGGGIGVHCGGGGSCGGDDGDVCNIDCVGVELCALGETDGSF